MIPINYNHTSNARTSSNIAYRERAFYHAASDIPYFLMALSILMTGVMFLGMLRCERRCAANIGFEGTLIFVLYLGGTAVLVAAS